MTSTENIDEVIHWANKLNVKPILEMTDAGSIITDDNEIVEEVLSNKSYIAFGTGEIGFTDFSREGWKSVNEFGVKVAHTLSMTPTQICYKPVTKEVLNELIKLLNDRSKTSKKIDRERSEKNSVIKGFFERIVSIGSLAESSDFLLFTSSDVGSDSAKIEFRIHGDKENKKFDVITNEKVFEIGSYIVDWAANESGGSSKKVFDPSIPQDAKVNVEWAAGKKVQIRYSHAPADNFLIVMRLLSSRGDGSNNASTLPKIYELDMVPWYVHEIVEMTKVEYGLILVVGPTGSGKSTLLGCASQEIDTKRNTISYEDPVENYLPNVHQIGVDTTRPELDWGALAVNSLRLDPEVIIQGEIRDEAVLKETFKQARTGHLVLGTLHANNCVSAVSRLVDMGENPAMLRKTIGEPGMLKMIISQRLTKRICKTCSIPLSKAVTEKWANLSHERIFHYFSEKYANKNNENGDPYDIDKILTTDPKKCKSCPDCKGKGSAGRQPLMEVLIVEDVDREFILEDDATGWVKDLERRDFQFIDQDAEDKVLLGNVCPLSVEGKLGKKFGLSIREFNYQERKQAYMKKINDLQNRPNLSLVGSDAK